MKKMFLKFAMLFAFIGIMVISCEEPPPPVPACESQGYGDVKVKNTTGYNLWVDCTYTSNGTNYEKKLSNGSSYSYQMDKGTVYIWASFDGSDWVYDTEYLSACENLTYTWYLDNKKSTGRSLYLIVTHPDGQNETIEGFEAVNKYE